MMRTRMEKLRISSMDRARTAPIRVAKTPTTAAIALQNPAERIDADSVSRTSSKLEGWLLN